LAPTDAGPYGDVPRGVRGDARVYPGPALQKNRKPIVARSQGSTRATSTWEQTAYDLPKEECMDDAARVKMPRKEASPRALGRRCLPKGAPVSWGSARDSPRS